MNAKVFEVLKFFKAVQKQPLKTFQNVSGILEMFVAQNTNSCFFLCLDILWARPNIKDEGDTGANLDNKIGPKY